MNTAVFVINRTGPTKEGSKTPYELWYGKAANIDNLKVFGTECFVHIPVEKRRKLDKKAMKGFLVGYIENCKGYRIFVPGFRDVVLSRDVVFKLEKVCSNEVNIINLKENTEVKESAVDSSNEIVDENAEQEGKSIETLQISIDNDKSVRELRDRRRIKHPDFYGSPITFVAEALPENYNDAINSNEKNQWIEAMHDEINSLHENKTWILVEKPEKQKVISSRWVYVKKFIEDGKIRFKARLVIKGYSQKEGIDYKETFSPVARFDTVRFLLSIAAHDGLFLGQFDIKTAFLYGDLKENIYMMQPEGFNDGTARVCKLLKSLYGLKQAPRCWTEHFSSFIKRIGFCQSSADPCFYMYKEGDRKMFLVIYVDDGLLAASHEYLIDKFFVELAKEFKITTTKEVTNFLGAEIIKLKDGSIFIHQAKYIRNVLEKFKLNEANSVCTPIEVGWNAGSSEENNCNAPYREAVGSLMYLQVLSRPDISYAVNIVSRTLEKPSEAHWRLVKRIIRYLKGTVELGLFYTKGGNFKAYSDADYAGDRGTRKSTSGIVCQHAHAAISWQSNRQ